MLLDTIPNVNRVFALITQQERQFSIKTVSVPKILVTIETDASDLKRSHESGSN